MLFRDGLLQPGYFYDNPFNSGSIKYLVADNNCWQEVKLNDILVQPSSIDFNSLITTIIFGRSEQKTSLFNNVECIVPGCSFRVNRTYEGSSIVEYVDWKKIRDSCNSTENPADMLSQFISERVNNAYGSYFVVRLSGGLDSTGILLALMETVEIKNIIAVTYSYQMGSSNEDEIIARNLCNKYRIRLIVINYEPNALFHRLPSPVAPVLNMRVINFKIHEKEIESLQRICGDNFVIFDGHGGDHVFCEKIPLLLPKELFIHGHPLKAFRAMLDMARLYGIGIKDVVFMSKNQAAALFKEAQNYFIADALKKFKVDYKNIDEDRRSTLHEAIIDNGTTLTLSTSKYDVYPFTDRKMVGYGLLLNVEDSFNESYKRIQYRNAIQNRYHYSLTRKDKGHITGAYQAAFKFNRARIINLIRNGQLAKHDLINISHIEKAIDSASRGIGGVSSMLIKIIAAEIIFEGYY